MYIAVILQFEGGQLRYMYTETSILKIKIIEKTALMRLLNEIILVSDFFE